MPINARWKINKLLCHWCVHGYEFPALKINDKISQYAIILMTDI
jgi:hypothetical protein